MIKTVSVVRLPTRMAALGKDFLFQGAAGLERFYMSLRTLQHDAFGGTGRRQLFERLTL
jgi:hypothetical protein